VEFFPAHLSFIEKTNQLAIYFNQPIGPPALTCEFPTRLNLCIQVRHGDKFPGSKRGRS